MSEADGAELVCSCDRPQLACDWVIYYTLPCRSALRVLRSGPAARTETGLRDWQLTERLIHIDSTVLPDINRRKKPIKRKPSVWNI